MRIKEDFTLNILGQDYKIKCCSNEDSQGVLNDERDGVCDSLLHEIFVYNYLANDIPIKRTDRINENHKRAIHTLLRHEIIHAMIRESGIDRGAEWLDNEDAVNWISLQLPKIINTMIKAHAFNEEDIETFKQILKEESEEK